MGSRSVVAFAMSVVFVLGTVGTPALAGIAPDPDLAIPEDGDPGRGAFFYDEANDRYYEVVLFGEDADRTWFAARDDAAARTIFGGQYRGHLATPTTLSQNTFVLNIIGEDFAGLWIGASDDFAVINQALGRTAFADQAASEGEWHWVTGPAAGTQFWSGDEDGAAVGGAFSAWQTNEPNNAKAGQVGEENFAVALFCSGARVCAAGALWNDATGTPSSSVPAYVTGYLVAFAPVPAGTGGSDGPRLTCAPDPVTAGAVVTCEVTSGSAGAEILWRASLDGPFAGQGVTLGADGSGTFAFVAPVGAVGRSVLVELVGWDVATRVDVVRSIVPASIPAGGAPSGLQGLDTSLGLVLLMAGILLRRRHAVR